MKKNLNLGERELWLKYNTKGKKEDVINCRVCFSHDDGEKGKYSIPQIKLRSGQPNKFGGQVGEYFATYKGQREGFMV